MIIRVLITLFISICLVSCSTIVAKTSNLELIGKRNEEKKLIPYYLLAENHLLPLENSRPRLGTITHIVIHFISNALRNPVEPYNFEDIYSIYTEFGFSTHYMIGRKGEIFRFVPEERVAFHAGPGHLDEFPQYDDSLNEYSIGIELLAIGTREEMLSMIPSSTYDVIDPSYIGYTDAQYDALNTLLNNIIKRNPFIVKDRQHIIGHNEYAPERKPDPGSLFDWSRIGGLTPTTLMR